MNYLFTAVFYSSLIPMGLIYAFFGLIIIHLVDKWILIKRSNRRREYSSGLSDELTDILEYSILLFAMGCVL